MTSELGSKATGVSLEERRFTPRQTNGRGSGLSRVHRRVDLREREARDLRPGIERPTLDNGALGIMRFIRRAG